MEDSYCEGLDVVLKSGTSDPTSKSPDGYCAVDGSTDLSHSVETCLRCVQSSGSHKYLSNCKFGQFSSIPLQSCSLGSLKSTNSSRGYQDRL